MTPQIEAMDSAMKATFEAMKPKPIPLEQYAEDTEFRCPSCEEIVKYQEGDLVLCDVVICADCVTTDLERIAKFVEANYTKVCNRLRQVREALEVSP